MDMYFWVFSVDEEKKEKKTCEKKNEKKSAETVLGYCPNCVTIQWEIVY